MDMGEKTVAKFDKLILEGNNILRQNGWDGEDWHTYPSKVEYSRFRVESMNLIGRVCGKESDHYLEMKRISENTEWAGNSFYFSICFGTLEAAFNDYKEGFLFDMRALISAELLGDFIDQAEYLIDAGYHIAAASLAGAVLEGSLRKIAEKNELIVPEKTKIDKLNSDIAKANVYDLFVQKQITAFADLRNNADHGHIDKVKVEDVKDMIKWVKRFDVEYLS